VVERPAQFGSVVHVLGGHFGFCHDCVFWDGAECGGRVAGMVELERSGSGINA